MKKHTYCFGAGREDLEKALGNSNPGPQEYSPLKTIGTEALAFKLKYKIPTIEKVEKTFIDAITNVSIQEGKLVAGTIFGNVYIYSLKDFK